MVNLSGASENSTWDTPNPNTHQTDTTTTNNTTPQTTPQTPHALPHTTQHNITHNVTRRRRTEKERQREDQRRQKREERRDGVWSVWCMLCGVCAQVRVFTCFFFACDGVGAVDLPQRVFFLLLAAVSSIFHMLSNVNMWKSASNCCEKQRLFL